MTGAALSIKRHQITLYCHQAKHEEEPLWTLVVVALPRLGGVYTMASDRHLRDVTTLYWRSL
jgi:hypothetical protein